MYRWTASVAVLACLFLSPAVKAQSSPAQLPLRTQSLNDFSKLLREVLLLNLPPALEMENVKNWGQQAMVRTLRGLKVVRTMCNDGNWQKTRATSGPLNRVLELDVRDLSVLGGEMFKFKVFLALPTTVQYQQQTWKNGFCILATNARARLRIKLDLSLETRIKLEKNGETLPDLVIDFKIADAKVSYDTFVLENINGVGGGVARVAGEAARVALRRWLPSVERNVLDRGRDAILKAGQSREVRINLAKLLPSIQ